MDPRRGAGGVMAASGLARTRALNGPRLPRVEMVNGAGPRSPVAEIQRTRLMASAVAAIDELGYQRATVGQITARARVSRRTFYETFANRDACLVAILDQVVELVGGEFAAAGLAGLSWRERLRAGMWTILTFFDREPALARVCVGQALRAGPQVLSRREAVLAQLAAVVDEGRLEGPRGEGCTPLLAEGLVGAAFAIVHARLARIDRESLTGLLGELTAMLVLPYLGPAAARRERERPAPAAAVPVARVVAGVAAPGEAYDPLDGVKLRLTHRTARVLEAIAELGDAGVDPSNRQVANAAGITDPGQISKLLRRLERLGLLVNTGAGHAKGEPNAWALTTKGERVAQSIRPRSQGSAQATERDRPAGGQPSGRA